MAYEFKIQRRIEFSETDMAGIVHFSNFFRYMEFAEHAFYRSLGFSAMMDDFEPPLGLPRVHAQCDYHHPLRFEQMLEIHLLVRERRPKVITYDFRFRSLQTDPPTNVARGRLTVVCVRRKPDGTFVSTVLPEDVAAKITAAPPECLAP